MLFCGMFEHGVWRRRIYHEHAEMYVLPDILTVMKSGSIRMLMYVMSMLDSSFRKSLSEFENLHGWEAAY